MNTTQVSEAGKNDRQTQTLKRDRRFHALFLKFNFHQEAKSGSRDLRVFNKKTIFKQRFLLS